MFSLKVSVLFSAILVLSCGFSDAGITDFLKRSILIDRTTGNNNVTYYLQPVDVTAFSVSRQVVLKQIDLPSVTSYNEFELDFVQVNVTIFETPQSLDGPKKVVFEAISGVNSTDGVNIELFEPITIKPDYLYEIQLKTPEDKLLAFSGVEETTSYTLKSMFKKIIVYVFQRNADERPQFARNVNSNVSPGAVSRIHFQLTIF